MYLDWKLVILQRWAGEYPPAKNEAEAFYKSSLEIVDELSTAGSFTVDEVSKFLAVSGYKIVFEGGYPLWQIGYVDDDKNNKIGM